MDTTRMTSDELLAFAEDANDAYVACGNGTRLLLNKSSLVWMLSDESDIETPEAWTVQVCVGDDFIIH